MKYGAIWRWGNLQMLGAGKEDRLLGHYDVAKHHPPTFRFCPDHFEPSRQDGFTAIPAGSLRLTY